VNKVRRKACPK